MKRSRKATVMENIEEYLKGKSEKRQAEFRAKTIEQQYSTIVSWKRRNEMKGKEEGPGANDVIKHANGLVSLIEKAEGFTEKEMKKMMAILDEVREKLVNFEKVRAMRELRKLERQQKEIARKIERLRNANAE